MSIETILRLKLELAAKIIGDYQKVTVVLGKGVGNITTPDGFFQHWNETEMAATDFLEKQVKRGSIL